MPGPCRTTRRWKIYRFLASLKLAVILLVALMVILAAATWYESVYDAKTAQHLVYGSPWFGLFLFMLGVNVFCAASVRYPWKVHQVGFLVTHAGILVILAGSFVTMLWGVDGSLALMEGESGSAVALDRPVLRVMQDGRVRDLEAEFRWDPPREGHEYRVPLGDGLTAVVDRYFHNAGEQVSYVEGDGPPAVEIRLKGRMADSTQWLTPASGPLSMGPATLSFRQAATDREVQAFLSGERPPYRGHLQVLVGGEPVEVDLTGAGSAEIPLGREGHTVQVLRFLPHAVVRNQALVSKDDEPKNPALELVYRGPEGQETWLLFAMLPDLNVRTDLQGQGLGIRSLYTYEQEKSGSASLELVAGPDGRVHYRLGKGRSGTLEVGKSLPTGWMDFQMTLEKALPRAVEQRTFRELKLASGQDGPGPAIRLRVEGARDAEPRWLRRGDTMEVVPPTGKPFHVGYGLTMVDLGFKLSLADFTIDYDPGTRNPASYRSQVQVDGQPEKITIQMNEPLHKNGFTFFQSSYQEINGEPMISVFSVAKDPGIWIKYVGSIMLCLGIAMHFYLRPYLLRKSHEAAMAALGGNP